MGLSCKRFSVRALIALSMFMGTGCAGGILSEPWPQAPLVTSISPHDVIYAVNIERSHYGLGPLQPERALFAAAAEQAMFQAATQHMSHYGYHGARLEHRLLRARYRYRIAGENVSAGRATPYEVVQAWMRSPPHREMMLHPGIQEIGVAIAKDETGRYYWAMVMADPAVGTPHRQSTSRTSLW